MHASRILNQDYIDEPAWTTRNKTSGSFYRLKQKIKRLLISLSGNDVSSMIKDVLTADELKEISSNYIIALKKISKSVNDKTITKSKEKHFYIRSLRESGIHFQEVKELGFKCSTFLWKSSLDNRRRNLGGAPRLPIEITNEIINHMEDISEIAANRSAKLIDYEQRNPVFLYKKKKHSERYVNAMYRQTTIRDSYKQFLVLARTIDDNFNLRRKNIKYSTFYKYIDKRFKKPFKLTDLCQYCEWRKNILKDSLSFNQRFFANECNFEYKSDLLSAFYKKKKDEINEPQNSLYIQLGERIKEMENLRTLEFHRTISKNQRTSYNSYRHDVTKLDGKLLIELDFKQKIILGEGPRQLNEEWFSKIKKQAVLLGFGVYFVETKKNRRLSTDSNVNDNFENNEYKFVNCLNIDVVTDYEGMTATDLIRIFKHVMSLPEFKQIDQDNYIVWTDCGTQFRCGEFIYFLMNELALQNKSVNLNFFAEKHGIINFKIKNFVYFMIIFK